jgi:hypothetical protein
MRFGLSDLKASFYREMLVHRPTLTSGMTIEVLVRITRRPDPGGGRRTAA